jgi:ATP phosphoribosyltransferase regulatory subunit HisZ
MSAENPGSLTNYAESLGVSIEQAQERYDRELDAFRQAIAEGLGITLEQLHQGVPQQHEQLELSDSNS